MIIYFQIMDNDFKALAISLVVMVGIVAIYTLFSG